MAHITGHVLEQLTSTANMQPLLPSEIAGPAPSTPYIPGVTATAPIATPTKAPVTTISGSPAQDHINTVIAPALAVANNSITDQKNLQANAAAVKNNAAPLTQQQKDEQSGFHNPYGYDPSGVRLNNPNTGASTQPEVSADVKAVTDTPETGYKFAYQADGTRVEIPVSSTSQMYGLSDTKPTSAQSLQGQGGITQAVPLDNGNQVAKLGNGSYAMLDGSGNVISTITAEQFAQQSSQSNTYQRQVETQAKNEIQGKLEQITNGTMPLSPWQQDQINNIKQEYSQLIAKQTVANANLEGGTRTLQGLLGMSQYSPGLAMGAIKQVVDDGITKIANLQSKMAADVGKMTLAFQQQNFDNLKTLYDEHQKNVDDAQKAIDTIQERIATAKKDQRDYEQTVATAKQAHEDKVAQLEFDKLKQDDTRSYQEKQLDFNKSQLSETTRHNKATEWEAEQKRLQEAAGNSFDVNTTPFASTITSVARSVGRLDRGNFMSQIADSAKRGDWTTMMTDMKNAVNDGLPAADRTKLNQHQANVYYLDNMSNLLKEYIAQGGDVGILKGTAQDISARLGQLATDPKFASLATAMNQNFVEFRSQVTGAAFSPEESEGYKKLVPTGDKSIYLNLAVIDGAKNYAQQQIDSVYKQKMGATGYENLKGVIDTEQTIQAYGENHPEDQAKILQMQAEGLPLNKIRDAFGL